MDGHGHQDDERTFVYRRPGAAPPSPPSPPPEEGPPASAPPGQGHTNVYHRQGGGHAQPGAAAKQKATLAGKNRASRKLRTNLLIGLVIVILAVCIILAAVLPGCVQTGLPVAPSVSSSSSSQSVASRSSASGAVGTVLPETEDAGDEYVEETLFLGDSNTKRLMEYSKVTGLDLNTAIGVEGMGIQSASTNALVRFSGHSYAYTMTDAVAVLQPRRVVITFGTNNIGGYAPEAFAKQYGLVLDALEQSYPYADIIIGAVPPVDKYCSYSQLDMEIIEAYNEELIALAEKRGCKFLDWNEALTDPTAGYARSAYTVDDGVHISEKGAEVMIDYFRTHSYITEDTRPMPLDAIPERLPIQQQVTSDGGTGGGIPSPPVSAPTSDSSSTESPAAPPSSTPPPQSEPVVEPSQPVVEPEPTEPTQPTEPEPGTAGEGTG